MAIAEGTNETAGYHTIERISSKYSRQGVVGHANTAWGRLYETYSMRYHGFSSGNELDTPDLIVGPVTRASLAILTTD